MAVANKNDRRLVLSTLTNTSAVLAERVHVLQLRVRRPSLLPPNLLVWSQWFIQTRNCHAAHRNDAEAAKQCIADVKVIKPHGPMPEVSSFKERELPAVSAIAFVYYSEADQILRVKSSVLRTISATTNASCLFVPRRREKAEVSDPAAYMEELDDGRECGTPDLFLLDWPAVKYVQFAPSYSENSTLDDR